METQFSPECLTISLGSNCNLNCLYCYSRNESFENSSALSEGELVRCIAKASEIVAENCKSRKLKFYLGFQGSGEPLLYFELLTKIYEQVSAISRKNGLELFSFITSNGCMEQGKYVWLARHFNRICLSIDGSKEMHDLQRRYLDRRGTYDRVAETIHTLKRNNKFPVVRTTITKYNVDSLVPIVRHFVKELGLLEIQIEPVYLVQRGKTLHPPPDEFVYHFLKARELASKSGGNLKYSGYRKNEIHSVYCNINKNVLFIGRNGTASICLFRDSENKDSPFVIGFYDSKEDQFFIDYEKVSELKKRASRLYQACENCEIQNSCVKGCPDICLFEADANFPIQESLRCQINQLLFEKENSHERNSGHFGRNT